MTVLPKKREAFHLVRNLTLRILYASLTNYRAIWYSASLLTYAWFTGWIAYEIFAWHKPITQVNAANFVGAIVAIALIWAETFLFKTSISRIFKQLKLVKTLKLRIPKMRNGKPSKLLSFPSSPLAEPTRAQLEPQTQPEQQTIPEQFEQPATSIPGCIYHFGYLHQGGKTKGIPDVCLTCKELIRCLV